MVTLHFDNLELLKRTHYEAVLSYFTQIMRGKDKASFYEAVVAMSGFEDYPKSFDDSNTDYSWLEKLILADFEQLTSWIQNCPETLCFDAMLKVYKNRFANGVNNFVDHEETYNAYTLFRMMGLSVCPYCEMEYVQELDINGQKRRTLEFDHFFAKTDFPALAMCFYNLVPSCKQCNQLKLTSPVAASPYDPTIESMSYFSTNLVPGTNLESTNDDDCVPVLSTTGAMNVNEKTLGLEQRYRVTAPNVRRWLLNKQSFPDEKLVELERMGFGSASELKYSLFGNPRSQSRGKELYTKLKEDLIGY